MGFGCGFFFMWCVVGVVVVVGFCCFFDFWCLFRWLYLFLFWLGVCYELLMLVFGCVFVLGVSGGWGSVGFVHGVYWGRLIFGFLRFWV